MKLRDDTKIMFLEKLEIVGFKSFAKKTILDFVNGGKSRGMTAIVGPNGSGKSNIAEAVRWVLGEQSLKSLRGKRSEDVIFFGSEKAGRLGVAEVSLYLNNEDRSAPIDYSEVVITRKVHRDGSGEYFINRAPVRLVDVHYLVSQCSIGQGSYAVIGQGMVDEVLSSSPAERIRFFEEAAGIRPLQIRLDESLRKLALTQENLKTVDIQLAEVRPRVRSLERQVERLEKHETVVRGLTALQVQYFGFQLKQLEDEKKITGVGLEEFEQRRAKQEELVKRLQSEALSITRAGAESNALSELQREYQKLSDERNRLKEKEILEKSRLIRESRPSKTSIPAEVFRGLLDGFKGRLSKIETLVGGPEEPVQAVARVREIVLDLKHFVEEYEVHIQEVKPSESKLEELHRALGVLDEKMTKLSRAIEETLEFEKKGKTKLWQIQNTLRDHQKKLDELVETLNNRKVQLARVDVRMEDVSSQADQEVPGGVKRVRAEYKGEDVESEGVLRKIQSLKREMELTGGIEPEVKSEFEQTKSRFDFLEKESGDLRSAMEDLHAVIRDLDVQMKQRFDVSFREIAGQFEFYFKSLFNGGKAKLSVFEKAEEPEDQEELESHPDAQRRRPDPESASGKVGAGKVGKSEGKPTLERKYKYGGVEIDATPPGKKLQSIAQLSGGERALTSIALICAIIASHPSPFVVLDEVDAALDEANSLRLAEILESLSSKTQFVIITHNRATMERSQILYGVTMGDDGVSKVVGLKLEEAVKHTNR